MTDTPTTCGVLSAHEDVQMHVEESTQSLTATAPSSRAQEPEHEHEHVPTPSLAASFVGTDYTETGTSSAGSTSAGTGAEIAAKDSPRTTLQGDSTNSVTVTSHIHEDGSNATASVAEQDEVSAVNATSSAGVAESSGSHLDAGTGSVTCTAPTQTTSSSADDDVTQKSKEDEHKDTTPMHSQVPVPSWEMIGSLLPGKLQHGGLPMDGISPRFPPLNQLGRIPFCSKCDPKYGNLLAMGLSDGTLQIWNVATNNLMMDVDAHVGPITFLSWSPDSSRLATLCQYEWCVRVWDLRGKRVKYEIFACTNIVSCEFHPFSSDVLAILPFGEIPNLVHLSSEANSYSTHKLHVKPRNTDFDSLPEQQRNSTHLLSNIEAFTSVVWGPSSLADTPETSSENMTVMTPIIISSSKGCMHVNWVSIDVASNRDGGIDTLNVNVSLQQSTSFLVQIASASVVSMVIPQDIVNKANTHVHQQLRKHWGGKRLNVGVLNMRFRLFTCVGEATIQVLSCTIKEQFASLYPRVAISKCCALGNPVDPVIQELGNTRGQQVMIESGASLGLNIHCTTASAARYIALHSAASASGTGGFRANTLCCSGTGDAVSVSIRTKNDHCIAVWNAFGENSSERFGVAALLVGDYVSLRSKNKSVLFGDGDFDPTFVESVENCSKRDGISSVCWHPKRNMLFAGGRSGLVRIWKANEQESWSAFSKWFKELQRNIHYVEHEDEFDLWTENDIDKKDSMITKPSSRLFSSEKREEAVRNSVVPQDFGKLHYEEDSVHTPSVKSNGTDIERKEVPGRNTFAKETALNLSDPSRGAHPGKSLGVNGVDVLHRTNKRNFLQRDVNANGNTNKPSQKKIKLLDTPDVTWALYSEGLRRINDVGKHAGLEPTLFYDPEQKLQSSLEVSAQYSSSKSSLGRPSRSASRRKPR